MTVAQTIADKCAEDGYDVASVLAYEKAHADRPAVVEALESLGSEIAESVEESEALEVEVV
jgi:hypothetical protein